MCSDTSSLRQLLDSPDFTFRFECGSPMPSSSITIVDSDALLNSISLHFIIYSQKTELDEIKRGLDAVLNVGQLMCNHPALFKPLLVISGQHNLKADRFLALFDIDYSVRGSNRRLKEAQIMVHLNHYIQELEGACKIQVCGI